MKFRNYNTTRDGHSFSESTKFAVFTILRTIYGEDPTYWRLDRCGYPIYWFDYGDTNSPYGWEIDHRYPVSHGGSDSLDNLQALQWRTNRIKGDSLSGDYCLLAAV